jgi:hypothetical protein
MALDGYLERPQTIVIHHVPNLLARSEKNVAIRYRADAVVHDKYEG